MSGRAITRIAHERAQDELDEAPFVEDELEPDQRWEEPPELETVEPETPQDALVAYRAEPGVEPELPEPVVSAP